ncbi:MAG: hypothetical protein ACTSPK_09330 [Candidatus Heimdallarchaeota archaeon]
MIDQGSKSQEEITKTIKTLIGDKDEVNLEWLKTVTQLPATEISKIIIQEMGMVILDGHIYSQEKAERKLKQMQEQAQAVVDKESFNKGPVSIDMMKLRERLWTATFPERVLGQERHQFCPIWSILEESESSILLRYDWLSRLEDSIAQGAFGSSKKISLRELIDYNGVDNKEKAKVIFAKTKPRKTLFSENESIWVIFLISIAEGGIRVEGLDMVNVLKISTKFRSREIAYEAMNVFVELINLLVNDTAIFEEVIICE